MSVYELAGKSSNLPDLEVPVSGLYLLAAPSTPEPTREHPRSLKFPNPDISKQKREREGPPLEAEAIFPPGTPSRDHPRKEMAAELERVADRARRRIEASTRR